MRKPVEKAVTIALCAAIFLSMTPLQVSAAGKPTPPKGLKSVALSETSLKLSWKKVDGAKKYVVYLKKGGKYVKAASPRNNSYKAKKLKAGSKYSFKVAVTASGGESKQSKAVTGYTKCFAPSGVKVNVLSKTSVQLTWDASKGAQKYRVYVSDKSSGQFLKAGETTDRKFSVNGLSAGTTYYFKVTAVNGNAESKFSPLIFTGTGGEPAGNNPGNPDKPGEPGNPGNPDPGQPISPTSVKVSLKSGYAIMPVTSGASTLSAAITPANANKDTAITWSSGNTAIATVDSNGKVTAKSAGEVNITARTANGKSDTAKLVVCKDVTSLDFHTDMQPSGAVKYEMKTGQTMPMPLPKIAPDTAYNLLTATSGNTAVVEVALDSAGNFNLKCKAVGTATITAKSHNNKTATFTVDAKAAITGISINGGSGKTMDVNTFWNNIPVALTPSGALPDYILKATDPNNANAPSTVLRIEQNKNAYSISPGTARVRAYVDGVEKASCLVTVNGPSLASSPGFKYYNVVYSAQGKATASLGVIPVSGAGSYMITEHVNYTSSMTAAQLFASSNVSTRSGDLKINGSTVSRISGSYRQWYISSSQATGTLSFDSVDTGLRFFSIAAYSGTNGSGSQIGSTFVGRVPVLYYPRNVGGSSQANADGVLVAFTMPMYWPSVGNFMLGGDMWLSSGFGMTTLVPSSPWALGTTFDKIPGASGYSIYCVHNGQPWGSVESSDGELKPLGSNRLENLSDYVFENGETILYMCPYVTDVDGTRSYGEMRTVTFNVKIGGSPNAKYWETSAMNNSSNITFNWN